MAIPRARLHQSLSDLLFAPLRALANRSSQEQLELQFINAFKERCEFNDHHISLASSCRTSLYLLLKSLQLPEKSLIALTPLTIPDIVNSVILAGHIPYLVELDPETHNIAASEIPKLSALGVRVAVLAHLSGIFNQEIVGHIKEMKAQGIFVIEDISQAYGSRSQQDLAGQLGDAFIGSLCLGKVISALGGGIWGVKSSELYSRTQKTSFDFHQNKLTPFNHVLKYYYQHLKVSIFTSPIVFNWLTIHLLKIASRARSTDEIFRSHKRGKSYPYDNPSILRSHYPAQFFRRLRKVQILLALKSLEHLKNAQHKRNRLGEIYLQSLSGHQQLPKALCENNFNTLWHFPVRLGPVSYQQAQQDLLAKNIDTCGYLLRNCNELACFQAYKRELPATQQITTHTIFLPIHESLSDCQARTCAQVFKDSLFEEASTKPQVIEKERVHNKS